MASGAVQVGERARSRLVPPLLLLLHAPQELPQQLLAPPVQGARAVAVCRVEQVDALADHQVEDLLQLLVHALVIAL
jgi:hypothetical protein